MIEGGWRVRERWEMGVQWEGTPKFSSERGRPRINSSMRWSWRNDSASNVPFLPFEGPHLHSKMTGISFIMATS